MAFTGATADRYGQHLTVQNGPNSIIETTEEYLEPGPKLLKLERQARRPEGRLLLQPDSPPGGLGSQRGAWWLEALRIVLPGDLKTD